MTNIKFEFGLFGEHLNGWPLIKILLNNSEIWNGKIQNQQVIDVNGIVDENSSNTLIVRHFGKDMEKDTVIDDNGNVKNDKHVILYYLKISKLKLTIDDFSYYNFAFVDDINKESNITNYFGVNGELAIKFEYPLWKFWYTCHQQV